MSSSDESTRVSTSMDSDSDPVDEAEFNRIPKRSRSNSSNSGTIEKKAKVTFTLVEQPRRKVRLATATAATSPYGSKVSKVPAGNYFSEMSTPTSRPISSRSERALTPYPHIDLPSKRRSSSPSTSPRPSTSKLHILKPLKDKKPPKKECKPRFFPWFIRKNNWDVMKKERPSMLKTVRQTSTNPGPSRAILPGARSGSGFGFKDLIKHPKSVSLIHHPKKKNYTVHPCSSISEHFRKSRLDFSGSHRHEYHHAVAARIEKVKRNLLFEGTNKSADPSQSQTKDGDGEGKSNKAAKGSTKIQIHREEEIQNKLKDSENPKTEDSANSRTNEDLIAAFGNLSLKTKNAFIICKSGTPAPSEVEQFGPCHRRSSPINSSDSEQQLLTEPLEYDVSELHHDRLKKCQGKDRMQELEDLFEGIRIRSTARSSTKIYDARRPNHGRWRSESRGKETKKRTTNDRDSKKTTGSCDEDEIDYFSFLPEQ